MWDPTTYLRYGDERSRPFHDLLARIGAERPARGGRPRLRPRRSSPPPSPSAGPAARVTGLDSSPEMIDRAAALDAPVDVRASATSRDWRPAADVDVVVTNAALQWVPGHQRPARAAGPPSCRAGAWLAIQVPGNFDAPSHRALREVADRPAAGATADRAAARGPGRRPGRLRRRC